MNVRGLLADLPEQSGEHCAAVLDKLLASHRGIDRCDDPDLDDAQYELAAKAAAEALRQCQDAVATVDCLERFFDAAYKIEAEHSGPDSKAASPSWLWLEPDALQSLIKLLSCGWAVSKHLIELPGKFKRIHEAARGPSQRRDLVGELSDCLDAAKSSAEATDVLRLFYGRELIRVAYLEFVSDGSPDEIGRQLSHLADAMIENALRYTLRRLANSRGMPERPDGSHPSVTVIGLGELGGQELSYGSALRLIFLFDAIDGRNVWHRDFYESLVRDLVRMLPSDPARLGMTVDLRDGPRYEVGVSICSAREATRIFETSGRISERLKFVKARIVAGSRSTGQAFLDQLEPWIYRQFNGQAEHAEIHALKMKLIRSTTDNNDLEIRNCVSDSGGIRDLQLTVEFLQLLHGGYLPRVRQPNFYDAAAALMHEGCLSEEEADQILQNKARLSRLDHQLSLTFDQHAGELPTETNDLQSLAYRLGIRSADKSSGDVDLFGQRLSEMLVSNRQLISSLMRGTRFDPDETALESELFLDLDPDSPLLENVIRRYGFSHKNRAIELILDLSSENVPFLSTHRCRHVFALLAPELLAEISLTPTPDETLATLAHVANSLGAKATLWELFRAHKPTMSLMVRICATTPYLSSILTASPGMIDELIDSLLVNHLPTEDRIDAHSIELCRNAIDMNRSLTAFKSGVHLTIGVRAMLGKETIEATHGAIADTAEACLRRVIEFEQEAVAERFGDPVLEDGTRADLIAVAVGKLGGREPNYHSKLDLVFLYAGHGETQRRVGGRRATTTNHLFFNQVARQLLDRLNAGTGTDQLYEAESRTSTVHGEGVLAISFNDFVMQYSEPSLTLWQKLMLCKARVITGNRRAKASWQQKIDAIIVQHDWQDSTTQHIRQLRMRMEQTASPENLKRGVGGTIDVELISQLLTLKHVRQLPQILRQNTVSSLSAIRDAGQLQDEDATVLIRNYRILRRIEAALRLMNTPQRHELPTDQLQLKKLAFLAGKPNAQSVQREVATSRQSNREIFNRIFDAN